MSFTCDNCGEKVGRATGADSHEYRCSKPDPPLCGKKCPSGYMPDCGYNRGHYGVCEGQYDEALVHRINQDKINAGPK
jgi:hypothetical protein